MRIASYVLTVANVVLWGGLSLLGVEYLRIIASHHVAGAPNPGQVTVWLAIPSAILLLSLVRPLLRLRAREENLGVGLLSVSLALVPFYALTYAVTA